MEEVLLVSFAPSRSDTEKPVDKLAIGSGGGSIGSSGMMLCSHESFGGSEQVYGRNCTSDIVGIRCGERL